MPGDVDRSARDPRTVLVREATLTARAERRLLEFELIRRRTLLALSVLLVVASIAVALVGHPYAGGPFLTGAIAAMAAGLPRREGRDR